MNIATSERVIESAVFLFCYYYHYYFYHYYYSKLHYCYLSRAQDNKFKIDNNY